MYENTATFRWEGCGTLYHRHIQNSCFRYHALLTSRAHAYLFIPCSNSASRWLNHGSSPNFCNILLWPCPPRSSSLTFHLVTLNLRWTNSSEQIRDTFSPIFLELSVCIAMYHSSSVSVTLITTIKLKRPCLLNLLSAVMKFMSCLNIG